MNKKKWLLIFMSCFLLLISGCRYTEEEKKQISLYQTQASENAVQYILNKYGFEATVKKASFEKADTSPIPDFTPPPTGNVYVTMSYQNKNFIVYITGTEKSIEGKDNYQAKDIVQDLFKRIKNVTQVDPDHYKVYYGYYDRTEYNGLVETYYTGQNLDEVLEEGRLRLVCEYIHPVDLKKIEKNLLPKNTQAIFVNYPSLSAYDTCSSHTFNILGTPRMDIYENALNIQDVVTLEYQEKEYIHFELRQSQGIYYADFDDNKKVTLTPTDIDDASQWNGWGAIDGVHLSQAFSISTPASSFYLYIPMTMVDDRYKDYMIGLQYDYKGEKQHHTRSLKKIGDYLVCIVYLRDYQNVKFVVMGDNGL